MLERVIVYSNKNELEVEEGVVTDTNSLKDALEIFEKKVLEEKAKIVRKYGTSLKPLPKELGNLYDGKPFYERPALDLIFHRHRVEYRNLSVAGRQWRINEGDCIVEIAIYYKKRINLMKIVHSLKLPYQVDPLGRRKTNKRRKRPRRKK